MELASYLYAAWAYEEAHRDSSDVGFDPDLAMATDSPTSSPTASELRLCKLSQNWRGRLLVLIAIANTLMSYVGLSYVSLIALPLSPAIAAQDLDAQDLDSKSLEPAINAPPWCDRLDLCDTRYILEVQRLLQQRGYAIAVDGVYGRQTQRAIIDFQKSQTGLAVDGIPGATTLERLRSAVPPNPSPNPPSNPSPNPPISPVPPIQPPIRRIPAPDLAIDSEVGNLQLLLKQRGFYEGDADGVGGRSTTDAIFKAQQAYGLVPDGFAGTLTMRALMAGGSDKPVFQPRFSQLPVKTKVRDLQELLQVRGFYGGLIDGIYGTQTKNSVLKAQLAYGQEATGELTDSLISSLNSQDWRSPSPESAPSKPQPASPQVTPPPQNNNPANPPPIPAPNSPPPTNNPSPPTSNATPPTSNNINVNLNLNPRLSPNISLPNINNGQVPVSSQNAPI